MKCPLHKHLHFGIRILGELDGSAGWSFEKTGNYLGECLYLCVLKCLFFAYQKLFISWHGMVLVSCIKGRL